MDGNRSFIPLTFLALSFVLIIASNYKGVKVFLLQPTTHNYKLLLELFVDEGFKFNVPYPLPNKPLLVLVPKNKLRTFHRFMKKNDIPMETVVNDLQTFRIVLRRKKFQDFTHKGYPLQKFDPFFSVFANDTYESVLEFLGKEGYLEDQPSTSNSTSTENHTTPKFHGTDKPSTSKSTSTESITTPKFHGTDKPSTSKSTSTESITTPQFSGGDKPSTSNSTSTENHTTPEIRGTDKPSTSKSTSTESITTPKFHGTDKPSTSQSTSTESITTPQFSGGDKPSTSNSTSTESITTPQFRRGDKPSTINSISTENQTTLEVRGTDQPSTTESITTPLVPNSR